MNKETYWSQFAESFDKKTDYVVGYNNQKIILNEVAKQKDLQKTLELGCGTGTFSKVLSNLVTNLTACDLSDEMISMAKIKLKDHSNIIVEKANCFNLPFKDKSFDTVFMANLLHVIPEPKNALKECKRVLKDKGKLIIVSYTSEGMCEEDRNALISRYIESYGPPSSTTDNLTLEKTKNMLNDLNYKIKNLELIGEDMKAVFAIALS